MEQRKTAATLVEELPEFEWDGRHYFSIWPESGERRAYTPEDFFETLARMAQCARQSRIAGILTAEVIPFRARDRA